MGKSLGLIGAGSEHISKGGTAADGLIRMRFCDPETRLPAMNEHAAEKSVAIRQGAQMFFTELGRTTARSAVRSRCIGMLISLTLPDLRHTYSTMRMGFV